ncbi:Fc.00g029160.m01.CDS01 [Cosmosporella sp. VM-42]
MSSRQLRKLRQQKELERAQDLNAQGESSGDEATVAAKPRVSLFAALGGNEDEAQEEDEQEEEVKEDVSEVAQPASAGKSKKKKKKKKKGKAEKSDAQDEAEDEIDKAIKELNLSTQRTAETPDDTTQGSTRRINDLLSINPYHLKALNEMRSLFGREIITSAAAEEEAERARARTNRRTAQQNVDLETFLRGPPGQKKLPEVSLRRNVFIQGREYWPRQTAGGLTMREVKRAEDGSWTEYAYVHEGDYDAVQAFFFACVQIGDPMRMVHLLKEVPYHISTLLQVSSVAKQDQNMALAAELCERALFTFGRVTTSQFRQNIEQGKARLDFHRPENRQFWLAGYHYLKSLIRKGTFRTALEWAKLLYSFDPKDPYAMRHFIHLLAIRAHESRWLIDFLNEVEKSSDTRDTIYLRQSLVLAKLQMGETAGARADLVDGMKRLPWLYCALFQELNLDTPPSIWGINADSDARAFWVKLYIYQMKDLWNNAQAIGLLQEVAKSIEKADLSSLPSDDSPPDRGATRLAYLDGQTSLLAVAPRELLDSQPNYEFDPLPPPEEENIFTGEGTKLPWQQRPRDEAPATEIEARMRNMIARHAAPAPAGGVLAVDQDDEVDLAGLDIEDEELRRDLEEHARGGNGAGLFATLLQLLGGRGGGQAEDRDNPGVEADFEEEMEGVPGSWPEDDAGSDNGHAPNNQY